VPGGGLSQVCGCLLERFETFSLRPRLAGAFPAVGGGVKKVEVKANRGRCEARMRSGCRLVAKEFDKRKL